MEIRIKQCSSARYWYRNSIGQVFNVYRVNDFYWVRDNEGFTNLVELYDAEEVKDERMLRIIKCSNPVLWYNDYKGSTFEVSQEDEKCFWVKLKQDQPGTIGWIYKTDVEVL
jgi:hypothetical protein